MEGENGMIISFKMVDGSRYDVPANQYQKAKMFKDLNDDSSINSWHWLQAYDENEKLIILRTNNIVSITINGDADDGKTIS